MQEPFKMPEDLEKMIDEYLGEKALAVQKGQPLGVWVVGVDGGNDARYIPINIFLRDILVSFPEDEMAWFAQEMEELDPDTELMIMFIIDEDNQGLTRYKVKKS